MVQGNEVVFLMLGIGVLIFIIGNFSRLKNFPASKILIAGFILFFTGWVFTVLEGFFLESLLNLMRHICYLVGSVLISIWCWETFGKKGIG